MPNAEALPEQPQNDRTPEPQTTEPGRSIQLTPIDSPICLPRAEVKRLIRAALRTLQSWERDPVLERAYWDIPEGETVPLRTKEGNISVHLSNRGLVFKALVFADFYGDREDMVERVYHVDYRYLARYVLAEDLDLNDLARALKEFVALRNLPDSTTPAFRVPEGLLKRLQPGRRPALAQDFPPRPHPRLDLEALNVQDKEWFRVKTLECPALLQPAWVGRSSMGVSNGDWHATRLAVCQSRTEAILKLLDSSGSIYLKPSAGTCQGRGILRLNRHADGRVTVESDYVYDIARLLNACLVDQRSFGINVTQFTNSIRGWFGMVKEPYRAAVVNEVQLKRLIALLSSQIAEARIPIARIAGRPVEFRMLLRYCEASPGARLIGHYAKIGATEVAGNVALGARGKESVKAISRLIRSLHPIAPEGQIKLLIEQAYESLVTCSERFAAHVFQIAPERRRQGISLDIVPIARKGELQWAMVEVQPAGFDPHTGNSLGLKGLRRANSDLYHYVSGAIGHGGD